MYLKICRHHLWFDGCKYLFAGFAKTSPSKTQFATIKSTIGCQQIYKYNITISLSDNTCKYTKDVHIYSLCTHCLTLNHFYEASHMYICFVCLTPLTVSMLEAIYFTWYLYISQICAYYQHFYLLSFFDKKWWVIQISLFLCNFTPMNVCPSNSSLQFSSLYTIVDLFSEGGFQRENVQIYT